MGYLIRACPSNVKQDRPIEDPVQVANDEDGVNVTENQNVAEVVVDNEVPGPSSVQTAAAVTIAEAVDIELLDRSVEGEGVMVTVGEEIEVENEAGVADAADLLSVNDDAVLMTELDECAFKTPQKRCLEQRPSEQHAKRGLSCDLSQTDTESESDFSEFSVTCSLPQSGFSNKSYSADDIKTFLKTTKNLRKVRIEEYFPDILQFIDKAKMYRSEGCFSNLEVYRLKKILAKLNAQSELNSTEK